MAKTGFRLVFLLLAMAFPLAHAFAQGYPNKPIRVFDAFPPGGTTDVVARIISPRFAESTGQHWVIESRPGAQGIIGTEIASKAPADGYTLLMYTASHTIHPSFYKNLPYDLLKAFATELFKSMARVDMTHIPYKGSALAIIDMLGGQIDLMFVPMPIVLPHVKSGKLRVLAVSTAKRAAAMPGVPTVAESGLPGYEATNSHGVLALAGTPREVINKLNAEIVRILNLPDVRERLIGIGAEPVGNTPEQFGEYLRSEIAKWAKVIKDIGMTLQPW